MKECLAQPQLFRKICLKNLADQKPRGNNSKGVFLGPIRPAESESELSLAQKNPDHEI